MTKGSIITGILAVVIFISLIFLFTSGPGEGPRANVNDYIENPEIIKEKNEIQKLSYEERGETLVNKETSTIKFIGYAPGKEQAITFKEWVLLLTIENEEITGFRGQIKATSLTSGNKKLDQDLKSENYFNIAKHPDINIETVSITGTGREKQITVNLHFMGIIKELTFPAKQTETGLTANFFLDTTPFGWEKTTFNNEIKVEIKIDK